MMTISSASAPIAGFLRKLRHRFPLSETAQEAVLYLPAVTKRLGAGSYLYRDGDKPTQCFVLSAGFAQRNKLTGAGARQIVAVHVEGDLIGLPVAILGRAAENVQTLTSAVVAEIPVTALRSLMLAH